MFVTAVCVLFVFKNNLQHFKLATIAWLSAGKKRTVLPIAKSWTTYERLVSQSISRFRIPANVYNQWLIACKMFTLGFRTWLNNVVCVSSLVMVYKTKEEGVTLSLLMWLRLPFTRCRVFLAFPKSRHVESREELKKKLVTKLEKDRYQAETSWKRCQNGRGAFWKVFHFQREYPN